MKTQLIDLLLTAQGGDESAAVELVNRFSPLIRACCQDLMRADREDLEQELRIQMLLVDRAHVGIGLLPSGDVLHIVGVEYCSKQDLSSVASEFNPTWFQIFDGGGSVGVIDKNDSPTTVINTTRPQKVAFIMKQTSDIPWGSQFDLPTCIVPPGYTGPTPCD